MDATRWPMDFDSLKKGDVIDIASIEKITGKTHNTKEYMFAVLNLIVKMRSVLFKQSKYWTIVIKQDAIHILDDVSASEYNAREYESARGRLKRLHVQCLAVDSMQLSDEQREVHYRTLQKQAFEMSAMRSARLKSVQSVNQITSTVY